MQNFTMIELTSKADGRAEALKEADKHLRELSYIKSGCGEWIETHDEHIRAYERAKVLDEVIKTLGNDYWNIAKIQQMKEQK